MENTQNVSVIWRGNKYVVEMDPNSYLKELGHELKKLTGVKEDTLRLIVPKTSKLLSPFSDEQSLLSLREASINEGKSIRMMGSSEDEVDNIQKSGKADLRIAGFDEEEKRMRQRMLSRPHTSLKLPQGHYVFCDFRTLKLPGVELNPPASEALKRMHTLASDPGIVAIMNKHRWRVGIMTEMAPVGYVGVSPKCILGFNKNHGEEISLRLRTDDLKGFRKYQIIKKTLLHELAHMVFSEHDANFFALNKQLNEEAESLDWTKAKGHTLSRVRHIEENEEYLDFEDSKSFSQKLGGNMSDMLASARASSVIAAYQRLANASTNSSGASSAYIEPNPDNSATNIIVEPVPNPDNYHSSSKSLEPDPDDSNGGQIVQSSPKRSEFLTPSKTGIKLGSNLCEQNNSVNAMVLAAPDFRNSPATVTMNNKSLSNRIASEPDPHDLEANRDEVEYGNIARPVDIDSMITESVECAHLQNANEFVQGEPDPDESQANGVVQGEPDPDDNMIAPLPTSSINEPDPDDLELWRIRDSVSVTCARLQKAIEMLQIEAGPKEVTTVLQTLFKIVSNVIAHPDDMKFKKLRKANPIIQKTIANYKAAMDILILIGFSEDVFFDDIGRAETYIVLQRNDPGLLWLAKSSLEARLVF